ELNDLTIHGGKASGPRTFRLEFSIAGSFMGLNATGSDTIIVGNDGVIDNESFPGQVILNSDSPNARLPLDNSSGPSKTLVACPSGLTGLTAAGVTIGGFSQVAVNLGDADSQVTVSSLLGAVPGSIKGYTFNGGTGNDTVTVLAPGGALTGNVNVAFNGG